MPVTLNATQYEALEWSYASTKSYSDPFNDLELDVILSHVDGKTWRVPAFWAGGNEWRVRFAPPLPGTYQAIAQCSDPANPDLNGQIIPLEAAPYQGANPLLAHGALRVTASGHYLSFEDGTPFFWLGDTWWMGLCARWSWPEDFQLLTADRVAKGFSVIQIVAGLYPDMPPFDPRGANEAGFPWEADYARINPAYFDMADRRIRWLVQAGLMPCIVSCWGYYLAIMGLEKMKQHWRNLVARWGAYPVVWCLAGEASMPYYEYRDRQTDAWKYQPKNRQAEIHQQIRGWTEVGHFLRAIDPYKHPVTIHPTSIGREQVDDDSVLEIDMLQTGHGGYGSMSNTVAKVRQQRLRLPHKPVVVGEVSYEGILHDSSAEQQRLVFWAGMLSGSAGHTYGANGMWQINRRGQPFGASPHGGTWGDTPWEEAYRLLGSTHIGLGKRLLERYPWQQFESHPEWTVPQGGPEDLNAPFAAGIPRQVRIFYLYKPVFAWAEENIRIFYIEPDVAYRAYYWNPRSAQEHDLGTVKPDEGGSWQLPLSPTMEDWVLVLDGTPIQGTDTIRIVP